MGEMEEGGMMTPGFRFYPTEDELISFYFKHKIEGTDTSKLLKDIDRVIPQLHVYDFYPWDLPQQAGELCRGDPEQWFFFIPRQEKEARGGRTSRLTSSGYWKATGCPSIVYSSSNRAIGIKRTMVFYNGRAPTGKRTKWKMNEYKAFREESSSNTNPRSKLVKELSLCRIYIKSNCVRAFDRRPLGVMICEPKPVQHILHDNHDYATTSTHYSHQPIIERTVGTSYHSRNSPEQQTANNSWSMTEIQDQHLWEWEDHHNLIQNLS